MKLPTIRRIPDDLWLEIAPILGEEKKRPRTRGRAPVPFRKVLDGILYVLRTGCQWKALPGEYGSGSTCHRRFQQWVEEGREIRKDMDQASPEIRRCQGNQVEVAVVGLELCQGTFRGDSTGPNPTDRGKLGTKRHILTDQRGTPLSAVITGANQYP